MSVRNIIDKLDNGPSVVKSKIKLFENIITKYKNDDIRVSTLVNKYKNSEPIVEKSLTIETKNPITEKLLPEVKAKPVVDVNIIKEQIVTKPKITTVIEPDLSHELESDSEPVLTKPKVIVPIKKPNIMTKPKVINKLDLEPEIDINSDISDSESEAIVKKPKVIVTIKKPIVVSKDTSTIIDLVSLNQPCIYQAVSIGVKLNT